MAGRVLFVGLGGTGGVVLSRVKARLSARLRAAGWAGEFPDHAWSFLHIDVPTNTDTGSRLSDAEAGDAYALGMHAFKGDEYKGLSSPGDTYQNKDAEVRATFGANGSVALAGWRNPDPNTIHIPLSHGAGQWRAVGGLVGLASRDRIEQALTSAQHRLMSQESIEEAQALTSLFQDAFSASEEEEKYVSEEPLVVIASSMVGGAGAGMFLDVANIARGLFGLWVTGFLVTADGFNPGRIGAIAVANSWGLLSELQHVVASESAGPVGVLERLTYPGFGVTRGTFVFGSSNGQVRLSGDGAIERVVGEALASVASDDAVRTDLVNYAITNMTAEADHLEYLGDHGAFRSMGFGRLELGRDRFGRYVTDRFLGLAGRRVRSEHLQTLQDEQLDAAIGRTAGELRFISEKNAGLFEIDIDGDPNDQILDAIRPPKLDAHASGAADSFVGAGKRDAADVLHKLAVWIEERTKGDRLSWEAKLAERLDVWRDEVEAGFVAEVHRLVAEYGVPVAVRVLEMFGDDLKAAVTQLRNQANQRETATSKSRVAGQLQRKLGGFTGVLTPDMSDRLTQHAATILRSRFEARARLAAAEACDAVREFLVEPTRHSLKTLSYYLHEPGGRWEGLLKVLPQDGDFAAYTPAKYEVMIEKVDVFPKVFNRLVVETVGDDESGKRLGEYDAISAAVSEILGGDWLEVEGAWSPGVVDNVHSVGRPVRLRTNLSPNKVEELVMSWRDQPHRAMIDYLSAGLKSYVGQGDAQVKEFGKALGRVIDVAQPLGHTNSLVQKVHEGKNFRFSIGALPFLDNPAAQAVYSNVIEAKNLGHVTTPRWVAADLDSIDVLSNEGPYQAACYDTLMEPIRSGWSKATTGMGERRSTKPGHPTQNFGENRHTVPLTMALPLDVNAQKAAYLGLLIGHVTGQVNTEKRQVRDDRIGQWLDFPQHSYWYQYRWQESGFIEIIDDVKIAYLEASKGNPAPLRPYEIIITEISHPSNTKARIDVLRALTQEQRDELLELAGVQRAEDAIAPNLDLYQYSTDWWEFHKIIVEALDQLEAEIEKAQLGGGKRNKL